MREAALKALLALFLAFLFFSSCKGPGGDKNKNNKNTAGQPNASKTGVPEQAYGTPTAVGAPAPEITVFDPEGHPLNLQDLRGNVVVINFWATWCGTCAMEKPLLNRFYAGFRNNPHFRLITVLYNDSAENAKAYLAKHGYALPFYMDPGSHASAAYGLTGVPESYVVDKRGILRGKAIGPVSWDAPKVSAFIKKLLKE